MEFSVSIKCSGIPGHRDWSGADYDDIRNACETAGLSVCETEPGDTEYAYLATESGEPDEGTFWHEWCTDACDLTVSGIIDRAAFDELVESIGAYAEDCETLGTLGGPLAPWGGITADVSFACEGSSIILFMRATPIPGTVEKPLGRIESIRQQLFDFADDLREYQADRIWRRIRAACIATYSF